ncbi:MAG: hypothetical protein ABWY18_13770, partial [Tardiphaga sp.]
EAEFEKVRLSAQTFLDAKTMQIEAFYRDLQRGTEDRMRSIEDRVTRDVRTRIFSIALSIVVAAAGAMLLGSLAATRDVNSSVIALQNTIIATQGTIKDADKALGEQARKMNDASNTLILKNSELEIASKNLAEATTKFNKLSEQLDRAREDYQKFSASQK